MNETLPDVADNRATNVRSVKMGMLKKGEMIFELFVAPAVQESHAEALSELFAYGCTALPNLTAEQIEMRPYRPKLPA